jgi:histidyl-tRNA synthetase
MGDVVLRELLADRGLLPEAERRLDAYIVTITPNEREAALSLARRLRGAGWTVDYALSPQGVGKQFKSAAALGARRAIVLGPDELAAGVAVVRDMDSGTEQRLPLSRLGAE